MQLTITLDGKTYCGVVEQCTEDAREKILDSFSRKLPMLDYLQVKLDTGDILILAKEAIQKAHFIVRK